MPVSHRPRVRRGPRRAASSLLAALPLAAAASLACLVRQRVAPAWLGQAGSQSPAGTRARAGDVQAGVGQALEKGRRQFWRESGAAALAAAWLSLPEDADAFRGDRIMNAKKTYVPKIRAAYQKLEGLRDDIYLEVELKKGDVDSRRRFGARPCDWYSGLDSKFDGQVVLVDDPSGYGCEAFNQKVNGIALIPRGRCTFAQKIENAKAAGAQAVVVYDEKMSKMPLETQGKMGATRSKGIATRTAGDALTGGASILPFEQGKTIMGYEKDKPGLDGAMISLSNGTELIQAFKNGDAPRILDVKRFEFSDGIDAFIKKDLKKLLIEMELYGDVQRISKDDMKDPILKVLKKDRDAFAKAVRSKDYGEIRATFQKWNSNFDALGSWTLQETF